MRHQRIQRTPAAAPMNRAATDLPTSGYALIVDGQVKTELKAQDRALKSRQRFEGRVPMLEVKVYDVENKRSETIEVVAA